MSLPLPFNEALLLPLPGDEESGQPPSLSVPAVAPLRFDGGRDLATRTATEPLTRSAATPLASAELWQPAAPTPFVWNGTVTSWASGGHASPRPSRQREGCESPSAVKIGGQYGHGRQPVGELRGSGNRVKAEPFGCPAGSVDATARPTREPGKLTALRSTRNDEGHHSAPIACCDQFDRIGS